MKHLVILCVVTLFAVSSGCTKKSSSLELKGKTLNLYVKDNIKSGDPATTYDTVSAEPVNQVYETLYQYNYYKKNLQLVPSLAESMPQFSKDMKTVTIKLKKGVRFQNDPSFSDGKGREVKAQDHIYAWKRLALASVRSEGFWIFDNKVIGFNDFQKKYGDSKDQDEIMKAEIEGMKALDEYTIQLKLTKPYPQLLYLLAHNFSSPVAIEAVKKYGPEFINHPVGTGPYKVAVWEPTNKVMLVKNENFREELFPTDLDSTFVDSRSYIGRKLPLVDNIILRVVHEEQPRWLEFKAGNLDQIEIPKDNINEALSADLKDVSPELKAQGAHITIDRGVVYWYIIINTADKFLSEHKLVRQALSLAMDRTQWLQIFRNGRGDEATEWNPTSVVDRCGKKALKYGYNPEKAKELLAKAGFPNGQGLPVFKFDLRGANTINRQIGDFVAKSLANVGVKVDVQLNTFPAFLEKRKNKQLQIAYGGWSMDYPDAENNFALAYGPNESPGPNDANYHNPEFDKLYEKMAVMFPSPARRQIICQMDDILQEDAPYVFGFYENVYRLSQKKLKNFHAAEIIWNKYKYVDLDAGPTTTSGAHTAQQ